MAEPHERREIGGSEPERLLEVLGRLRQAPRVLVDVPQIVKPAEIVWCQQPSILKAALCLRQILAGHQERAQLAVGQAPLPGLQRHQRCVGLAHLLLDHLMHATEVGEHDWQEG